MPCMVRCEVVLEFVIEFNSWDLVGVGFGIGIVCSECGHVQSAQSVGSDVLDSRYVREPQLEIESAG